MTVRIERAGAVATVIVSRPEARNAIDPATARALAARFRELDADPTVHALVLWGEGGCFSAGADLAALAAGERYRLEEHGDGPLGPTRLRLSKPVIAAIAGHAVAGGLELALWCDLRIVEETAVLGVFCRRFGVPLLDGGTVRLPRLVGFGRALELILTGRPVGAAEALQMGLATRVVPAGQSRPAAEALAAELAALPQACLRADRASVYDQAGQPLAEALAIEHRSGAALLDGEELARGVRAFADGAGRHGRPR